jgi:hypothetical protein
MGLIEGSCGNGDESSGSIKCWGNSRLDERLAASKGPGSMKCVS